jgi:hypothetical protein
LDVPALGHRTWVIPAGRIPASGTGREPEFTSRDEVWLVNTGSENASVELTMYYEERDPIGAYRLTVAARRLRSIRVNDLIDPEAVPLEQNYAVVVASTQPIVVQVARYDTRQAAQTMSWSLAFAVPEQS